MSADLIVLLSTFNHYKISFVNDRQWEEAIELLTDLANNTRIWENNGHTSVEIYGEEALQELSLSHLLTGKPAVTKKKQTIGRNAPCPCGSGKKYKKCCLGINTLFDCKVCDYFPLNSPRQNRQFVFSNKTRKHSYERLRVFAICFHFTNQIIRKCLHR